MLVTRIGYLLLCAGTFFSAATLSNANFPTLSETAQKTVYVCVSKGATRYHLDRDCHGLKRCTHKIESTTIKKAQGNGLTLCKFED
ncbi:MAG: hypothetical protein ITG00_09560 [Flavobacterium sp.]|nr:hypothetical protein [Flavobacterium sp.]